MLSRGPRSPDPNVRPILRALLFAVLAVSACGAPDPTPSLAGLPEWTPSESMRVEAPLVGGASSGTVAASGWSGAVGPAGALALTRGPDGSLYLLDAEAQRVRVLTPDGAEARTLVLAGPGGPPGADWAGAGWSASSLRAPSLLRWDEDGLWVWHAGRHRLLRFGADGELREVEEPPRPEIGSDLPGDPPPYRIEGPLPGGGWVAAPTEEGRLRAAREDFRMPILRVDAGGEVGDTLWQADYRESGWPILFQGGESFYEANPFDAAPLRAVDWTRGLLVEVAHELEPAARLIVEWRGLSEPGTVRRSEIAFSPDPLSGDEVGEAVQFQVERLEARTPGRASIERRAAAREWLRPPSVRRPAQDLLVGSDGTVWIRLTPTVAEGGLGPLLPGDPRASETNLRGHAGGSRWVLVSPAGGPLARTTLPRGFAPLHAEGDRLLGIERSVTDGRAWLVELVVGAAGA